MSEQSCGCGCTCTGDALPALWNRPGLPALAYRVRTQRQSYAALIAALNLDARTPGSALSALTVREPDDPTLALADALACVLDVLSFYDERILNEGYLRTATERVSLLDLARQIGYELRPGLAAAAYLSFKAEDRTPQLAAATPDPAPVAVTAGTAVQSLPAPGKIPQTFETSSELEAWIETNRIPAQRWQEQLLDPSATSVVLQGTGLHVAPGDLLLLVADPHTGTVTAQPSVTRVLTVEADLDNGWTTVTLENPGPGGGGDGAAGQPRLLFGSGGSHSAGHEIGGMVSQGDMLIDIAGSVWGLGIVLAKLGQDAVGAAANLGAPAPGVFVLRQHASMFGHNAPPYATLSADLQHVYTPNWDEHAVAVTDNSATQPLDGGQAGRIDLDARYPRIVPGSWVALTSRGLSNADAFWVENVQELGRADYAMAATVTSLQLDKAPSGWTPHNARLTDASVYSIRDTAVWAQSEHLPLADVPIATDVSGAVIQVQGLIVSIAPGATIVVSGEPTDAIGAVVSEAATVVAVDYGGLGGAASPAYTQLTLAHDLGHRYTRSSVTVDANIVEATHGTTVDEVLGSSDGSANQAFTLRQKPLTYVSAATPEGSASSLVVRVQGVRWDEVAFLYGHGPAERCYLVRRDDDGTAHVHFGDGRQGAIPPPGANTITAHYRAGIGKPGLVDAGRLTLLAKRPPGIASVVNPLASGGAADPESLGDARANAPITVLSLDRAVSQSDYADYARSFAGIAKATASELWRGEERVIAITVAAADRSDVSAGTTLGRNLLVALQANHEPDTRVALASFVTGMFVLSVEVVIDPRYEDLVVSGAVSALLSDTYGFGAAQFGAAIRISSLVAQVLSVPGVVDAHIITLARAGAAEGTIVDPLVAAPASWSDQATVTVGPAELLILVPTGPTVTVRT